MKLILSCLLVHLLTIFQTCVVSSQSSSPGPTTELYRETAVVIKEVRKPVHKKAFNNKEDKYATDGFRRRKLHQFGDDFAFNLNPQSSNADPFFRDFSRVVSLPQSFPGSDGPSKPIERPAFDSVPQVAPNNFGGRTGFQRVRVPNPLPVRVPVQQLPPQPPAGFAPSGGDNAPFARFQRVVAPTLDHQSRPQSNFRRVPVFSSQLPPSLPPQPHVQSPPPLPQFATSPAPATSSQPFREEDTPVPLVISPTSRPTGTSERPAFRRLRPSGQSGAPGRRVRPSGNRNRENNSENSIPLNFETTTPATTTTSKVTTENVDTTSSTPESRRIVRIRKPGSAGTRRRVAVRPASGSTVRVPIQRDPADEERVNNALDGVDESPNNPGSSFGNRLQDESAGNVSPARSSLHQPHLNSVSKAGDIVPLTYYTTYTYLTTVLRGSHTLVTSRLSSTSSVSSQVLDESAIHFLKQSGGSIVPTKVVNIGSKTKGPTTTIVNIASEIRATHTDLAHILTAAASSSVDAPSIGIRNTRKPLIEAAAGEESLKTIAAGQLDSIPKTLLTKYTYYYTIIDGTNTRKSTRSEVASSALPDNESPAALNNIKVQPTVMDGVISLGSGPETVHLGKRSFGRSTTEVNLAMETYLRLEGISSAVLQLAPTSLPDPVNKPTTPLPDATSLRGSFSSEIPASDYVPTRTPDISPGSTRVLIRTRKPLRPVESSSRPEVVRSRIPGSGRPGLRVRIRPSSVLPSETVSSSLTTSSVVEESVNTLPPVTTEGSLNAADPTTPPPPEIDFSRVEADSSTPSKKKVAVTVTRRPFGGLNRLRTRTRSVVREPATESVVVPTPSSSVSNPTPISSRIPGRFRVSSRVIRPNFSSVSLNPNEHPEPPLESTSQPAVLSVSLAPSVSTTTVPIIRGLETSIRTLTFTTTATSPSPPVVSKVVAATETLARPPVLVTYFTTTTHTIPYTANDKTLYTTFEITNSRVATETLNADAATPAVTHISPSKSVHVPEPIATIAPSFGSDDLEINTMFTTFTFFTTFFNGDASTIKSSEKVISNVITTTRPMSRAIGSSVVTTTPAIEIQPSRTSVPVAYQPVTVVETTDRIETSTIYSTQTFFATLYNGNSSTITPIEETKTEILTLREPVRITRTINPKEPATSSPYSVVTRTYYTTGTSLTTLLKDDQIVTSPVQHVSSNVVTFTVPLSSLSPSFSQPSAPSTSIVPLIQLETDSLPQPDPSLLTTRTTQTTLTHYITLYSGTNTVLSSVTEVSPTVVTETLGYSSFNKNLFLEQNSIQRTSAASAAGSRLITSFVPSLSTHVMTHTYFTTLFSGTTSFVSSRSEIATSLVTLYVPSTASAYEPSKAYSSIAPSTTSYNLEPSLVADLKDTEKVTTTTQTSPDSDSRSSTTPKENDSNGFTSSESSAPPDLTTSSQSGFPSTSSTTNQVVTESPPPTTPAAVIDLEDILNGSGGNKKINQNLGAAIKDIVNLLAAAGKQNATSNSPAFESGKTPQPVYIPSLDELHAATNPTPSLSSEEVDVAPVFKPDREPEPVPVLEPSISSKVSSTPVESSTTSSGTPALVAKQITKSTVKASQPVRESESTLGTFINAEASTSMWPNHSVHSTRYVTSVESQTRTLTLTTTKVYYTRDSPLTITSVLTTVIPPKTFVSTIIGSRTILGTAAEPSKTIAPSEMPEGSTTITTTTLIFNSITTTVVRTLVIPTDIQPSRAAAAATRITVTKTPGSARPTRKPLSSVRTTAKTTPPPGPVIKAAGTPRKRQPLPKPVVPPELMQPVPVPGKPVTSSKGNATVSRVPVTTRLVPVVEDDECAPACNAANKEVCVERDGKYKCDCRPGYARKEGALQCKETNNYVLLVRVMKAGEDDVSFIKDFANKDSNEFKKLAKLTEEEVSKAYNNSDIRNNYLGADVTRIVRSYDDEDGVLVNLTLRVMSDEHMNEELLREELAKSLEDAESLPVPSFITAEVDDVMDLDECSHPDMNDCSSAARCINEPGSYTCKCKGIFTDLDPTNPGRSCAAEVKMCDLCNGRGDCFRDETGESTSCKCHRMYLGRYCEINGILLATLLPVAAILSIISVCCIVYCCRKYRKRSNISKGFRNITQFGPPTIGAGTLDRKAMLGSMGQETSSENSDHFRSNGFEGPAGQASMDPDSNGSTPRRRRGSEPGLDRCLAPASSGFGGMPPQVVIPRARHANQSDPVDLSDPPSRSQFKIRAGDGRDELRDIPASAQIMTKRPTRSQLSVPLPSGQGANRFKARPVQLDEASVRSKGSKYSCSQGDLMNFYAPNDETTSVYSKAASAIVPQTSPNRRINPLARAGSRPWNEWSDGREGSRPRSPGAVRRRDNNDRFTRSTSEAARSCNESIQFPPTKSRSRFGSEIASNSRGYTKGWRGNMIPERAESELSTTSFLVASNPRANRFPFTDHSSATPRGQIFPNWTTLPYGQDD